MFRVVKYAPCALLWQSCFQPCTSLELAVVRLAPADRHVGLGEEILSFAERREFPPFAEQYKGHVCLAF